MTDSLCITEKVRSTLGVGVGMASAIRRTITPKLRVELMRPVLVYRIQGNAFGSSTPRRKGQIQDLAANVNRRRFKTVRIIREWKDQLHEVAVTTEGYLYKGDFYKSLSPIAFRITGTKWSGPAFFGTKPKEGGR